MEKKEIPSLNLLANLYGDSTPIEWLRQQIDSLNTLTEARGQMSAAQINETISLILSAYAWLSTADVCLFIARIKVSTYGPFYGCITPLKILEFLRQYATECRKSRDSIKTDPKPVPVDTEERKPVTWEEYQDTLRKARAGDPDAIRELKRPPGI